MDNIAKLPQKIREELFSETAAQIGITPIIAEKDFWTCWVLDKLFNTPEIKDNIAFKGGTTLSKIFRLPPPDHIRVQLEKDFVKMWSMIFGDIPSFEEMMNKIEELEERINCLRGSHRQS